MATHFTDLVPLTHKYMATHFTDLVPLTHKYMATHFTDLKSGKVKLDWYARNAPLGEMMRSLKCFINYIIFVLLILVATLWSFDEGGVLFLKWRLYKKKKILYFFLSYGIIVLYITDWYTL